MGSNPELLRIQEWIGNWYEGRDCPFSVEDVRNICRGPMRQVLLDFLLPRFRTDEQIKVIRSNLFLNDLSQKSCGGEGEPPSQFDQKMDILKEKLNEVHQHKIKTVQQIVENMEKLEESKRSSQTKLMNLVGRYEKCEARAQLIRDRVVSTSILVQDLSNAKPMVEKTEQPPTQSTSAAAVSTPGSGSEISPSIGSSDALPHLPQLRVLYDSTSELFDLYLHQTSPTNNSSQPNSTPVVQALTATVTKQTTELVHSGIPPTTLEKWAKGEQDISMHKMKAMNMKFSNVMNPLEEMQNETNAIYTKLMYAHLGLHMRNLDTRAKLMKLKEENTLRIKETVFNDPAIIPSDFLNLIRREEQSKQLAKCRELAKQLKQMESACQNNEEELLTLLCEENLFEGKDCGNLGCSTSTRKSLRASLGPLDGNNSFSKQEALEDITCALLKSIPHSCKQLETTIQHSKNLVLERFPEILSRGNTADDRQLFKAQAGIGTCGMSSDDIKIKIPKQFIPNYDLLMNLPSERFNDDLLSEVFSMQKELEAKKLQSEAMLRERGSSEPACELEIPII